MGVMFSSSFFLLSTPGDYWPWFAIMGAFAIAPAIAGPGRYRVVGIAALIVAVVLIVGDVIAGKLFRERRFDNSVKTTLSK